MGPIGGGKVKVEFRVEGTFELLGKLLKAE
jgi:hypothetical protein